jgi:hypothetical protein
MNHTENHGKVGEALYLKFTPEVFYKLSKEKHENGEIFDHQNASVPVHIDKDTQGDWECVCENGVEIHYFND